MSSRFQCMWSRIHRVILGRGRVDVRRLLTLCSRNTPRLIVASEVFKFTEDGTPVSQLQAPAAACLTPSNLLKHAAVNSLGSGSALLTQTLTALEEVMEAYMEAVGRLTQLYTLSLQVLGSQTMEDKVWDKILAVRAEVNELRVQKEGLELLYTAAVRVVEATSEAAFVSGAETACLAANSLLQSANLNADRIKNEVEDMETRLREVEVRSIDEMEKKAQEGESEELDEEVIKVDELVKEEAVDSREEDTD